MFSPDFNPLLEVLKNHTDSSGNVSWNALISEVKTMASLFAGKAEMPHKGTAMEEMMKKMAESQGEEVAWQAAIGTDPIKDAFEVKNLRMPQEMLKLSRLPLFLWHPIFL